MEEMRGSKLFYFLIDLSKFNGSMDDFTDPSSIFRKQEE